MFYHKENLRRLKLFKELEPDFKIDKVFYLMEPIEYDFKYLDIGSYIVSKPFVSSHTGDTIVTIIDLERKMQGHKMDISTRTRNQGFTCWRIRENDFKNNLKQPLLELPLTFYIKESKMTNYKLFLSNYKLLKSGNTEYIFESYYYKADRLKIVKCVVPFEYDGLWFEKDNIYACYISSSSFDLFELTGNWIKKGHNGNLFTNKAMAEGMKGWHLRGYHKKFFEDFNEKGLSSFLYWGESYE